MTKSPNNPVAIWDITCPYDSFPDEKDLMVILRKFAKKWVFQLEEGKDSGYKHYQIRVSLIGRMRLSEMKKRSKIGNLWIPNSSWSITSNDSEDGVASDFTKGKAFYVMKDDTRIKGPWSDLLNPEPPPLTRQLKLFNDWKLRPYQNMIKYECTQFHMRQIDLIYDEIGNSGKSLLSESLEYEGIAEEVPPYRNMEDIFQWVCTRPIKQAYIIDLPRGMKKDKLGEFYSGVEVLKNGVAYDKRYQAKKVRFDRPRIFVFTNMLPEFDLMSTDRWMIWHIDKNYSTKLYSVEEWCSKMEF